MLEALSCLRVDWDAIGAVATASACVIALCVATRDGRYRKHKQRQILERTRILSKMDIGLLDGFHEAVVLFRQQPDSFKVGEHELAVIRKLIAAPHLRASLEEAEHLPNGILKAISAVLMVLDGHEALLLTASMRDMNWASFGEPEALRMAIDNLRVAFEKHPM